MKKIFKPFSSGGLPCFYCNIDSTELRFFVFGTIGALVAATLFAGIGLYLKGVFKNTEELNDLPLRLEDE